MKNKKNKIIGLVLILASIFTAVVFFEMSVRINQNYLKSSLIPITDESTSEPDLDPQLPPPPLPYPEEYSEQSFYRSFVGCISDAYYELGLCFRRCEESDNGGFIEELLRISCMQNCYNLFYVDSALCLFI